MSEPQLLFTMQLGLNSHLTTGNLALSYPSGETINYLATSGARGRQTNDYFWRQGEFGPIPPGEYWIPAIGYWSDTHGIKGMFFHIQPDPTSKRGQRSELGIHHDGGAPGTAGCIGIIRRTSFERFCDRLEALAESGIKKLPLTVKYD